MRKIKLVLFFIAVMACRVGFAQSRSVFHSVQSSSAYVNPKGTPYYYKLNAYVNVSGYTDWIGNYADTIYVDGTDVYIKNLVHSQVADGSYAKGELTSGDIHNGKITFMNGVAIAQNGVRAYLAANVDDAYDVDTTTEKFTFTIHNDTITIDSTAAFGSTYVLGWNPATKDVSSGDYRYWDGYTTKYKYIPFDASGLKSIEIPSGVTTEQWRTDCKPLKKGAEYSVFLNGVVRDGNEVYLNKLVPHHPDVTVKGTVVGDSIVIDLPLFLGKVDNMFAYLDAGKLYSYVDDDEDTIYDYKVPGIKQIKLYYDSETNTIKSDNALVFHADKHYFGVLYCPVFTKFDVKPTTLPQNAVGKEYVRLNTTSPDDVVKNPSRQNVYSDGSDIYFQYSLDNTSFVVKGSLNSMGDSLFVKVPQYLGESKNGYLVYFDDVQIDSVCLFGTWVYYYTAKEKKNELKFAVQNDSISFIGNVVTHAEGVNVSSAIINPLWIIVSDTVATIPSDAVYESYRLDAKSLDGSSISSSTIRVAHKGNQYYFLDHDSYHVNGAFEGTLSGNKLTVNSGQLIDDVNYIYVRPAVLVKSSTGTYGYNLINDKQITFDYNPDTKTFSYENLLVLESIGRGVYGYYYQPNYAFIDMDSIKLVAPVPLSWSDKDFEELKTYTFKSMIPDTTVEGKQLERNKMSYRFYFDDELYTFKYDKYGYYDYFDKDTVDIPYTYSAMDFVYSGTSHTNYFVDKPNQTIGIQSCYSNAGKKVWSDIVNFNIDSQVITSVDTKTLSNSIVNDEIYDISGRRINSSEKGFLIHRIRFANGDVKVYKELKK
jgi:hypothetical protein